MKSQASSTSTLDDSSTDDVWVKRIDPKDIARRKKVSSFLIPENRLIEEGFTLFSTTRLNLRLSGT